MNKKLLVGTMASMVTLFRVLLALVIILLLQLDNYLISFLATILIILVMYLDAVDGYLARKLAVATPQGAMLDIAGDRIIENAFWMYFAYRQEYSIWVPIIIMIRTVMVDMVRSLASTQGKTAFGITTLQHSRLAKAIVSSRWSRGLFNSTKTLTFFLLGLSLALQHMPIIMPWLLWIVSFKIFMVYVTLLICIIRGVPVLIEGWQYWQPWNKN